MTAIRVSPSRTSKRRSSKEPLTVRTVSLLMLTSLYFTSPLRTPGNKPRSSTMYPYSSLSPRKTWHSQSLPPVPGPRAHMAISSAVSTECSVRYSAGVHWSPSEMSGGGCIMSTSSKPLPKLSKILNLKLLNGSSVISCIVGMAKMDLPPAGTRVPLIGVTAPDPLCSEWPPRLGRLAWEMSRGTGGGGVVVPGDGWRGLGSCLCGMSSFSSLLTPSVERTHT
mmetsp:Transcript_24402/g.69980  ORF Transcript_24402/g.69980 Transcript_24402/m.69980 type:complete len:223 (+) Transcript_24402:195-863(+)